MPLRNPYEFAILEGTVAIIPDRALGRHSMRWATSLALVCIVLAPTVGVAGCGRIGYEAIDVTIAVDATDASDATVPIDTPVARDTMTPLDATTCTPLAPSNPCVALPALPAAPVIDGVLECSLTLVDVTPVGWTVTGSIPAGNHARAAFAWRDDGVYAFVEVTDPTRSPPTATQSSYCGDSVEIYVDDDGHFTTLGHYDDPGTSQVIVSAPSDAVTPSRRADVYRDQALRHGTTHAIAVPTAGGYSVEVFVSASDLDLPTWTLSAAHHIGLDLAVNVANGPIDGGGCGSRLGQYFVHIDTTPSGFCGTPTLPFCDTHAFCTPTLAP